MIPFEFQDIANLLERYPFPKAKDINPYYETSCLANALKNAGVDAELRMVRFIEKKPLNERGVTPIAMVKDLFDFKLSDGQYYTAQGPSNWLSVQSQFKNASKPDNSFETSFIDSGKNYEHALSYGQEFPAVMQWESEITAAIERNHLSKTLQDSSNVSEKRVAKIRL